LNTVYLPIYVLLTVIFFDSTRISLYFNSNIDSLTDNLIISNIEKPMKSRIPFSTDSNTKTNALIRSYLSADECTQYEKDSKPYSAVSTLEGRFAKFDSQHITLKSGLVIPRLGLGTYGLSGESGVASIQTALELGYRFIDTATGYKNHATIAAAIKNFPRKDIIICTKINNDDLKNHSVDEVVKNILKELETHYIDIVLIHNATVANFSKVIDELIVLKRKGKLLSIGVSNFTIRHLESIRDKFPHIDMNQIELHPYLYQEKLNAYCQHNNIHVMSYRAFAKGKLDLFKDLELMKIAKHHVKPVSQVILRSIMQLGHATVAKANSEKNLKDNQMALDFDLTQKDLVTIVSLNKNQRTCTGPWADFRTAEIDNKFDLSLYKTFAIKHIHHFGQVDVLNIEGGNGAKVLKPSALWLNLAFVLDRPLIDGVTLEEVTAHNTFSLKEMSLDDYNEIQVHLAVLLILNYYINEGHKILNKPITEPVNFLFHVHRGMKNADKVNNFIIRLLTQFISQQVEKGVNKNSLILKDKNVIFQFRYGYDEKLIDPVYAETDILFSYSLVAGFNPKFLPGTLTLPKEFIPFDIHKYDLLRDEKYSVRNCLLNDLDKIVAQPQEKYFETLNRSFQSENPKKQHKAKLLTKADFHAVTVLQVNGLFNPKDLEKSVTVVEGRKANETKLFS